MQLIGMLDSPYVRRTAIALEYLGVAFEHRAVSVFSTFEQFQKINPVVKAPSLVCDDGTVLMDSTLIVHYAEARAGKSLWSKQLDELQTQMRLVGLALAACEKGVQIVYERNLRPPSAQHEPWVQRVTGQLLAAYAELEREAKTHAALLAGANHASITAAVVWQFTQSMLASIVAADRFPQLVKLSNRMEATDQFRKYPPDGPGV